MQKTANLSMDDPAIERLIACALEEDVGQGDITSALVVPRDLPGHGSFLAKQSLVVCGLPLVAAVMRSVDPEIAIDFFCSDGQSLEKGAIIGNIRGRFTSLLTAERTALNFLTHLSGIATMTAGFVTELHGTSAKIYDTRKTIPGLRTLEKYAVLTGGGSNHRIGLYDAILIKNNHIAACGGDIAGLVERAKNCGRPVSFIEVEVETLEQVQQAIVAAPDIIMLDNMDLENIKRARSLIPPHIEVEVSGNVRFETVRAIGQCGVDRISAGVLTHSAPTADISLHITPGEEHA